MVKLRTVGLLMSGALVALGACASDGGDSGDTVGTLELELGDSSLSGSFELGDERLLFEADEIAPGVVVARLELNGMTLEATQDKNDPNGVVIMRDGYTTATGKDTQLLEQDRLLIRAFIVRLEADYPDIAAMPGVAGAFDDVIQKWGEWVPAMALANVQVYETARSGNQCYYAQTSSGSYTEWAANRFVWGWHDCWDCSYDGGCRTIVQMGDHCGSNGDEDVRLSTSGSTVCNAGWGDQGHATGRYAVGNCNGRYGSGCGSGHSYNWESLDHDNCVRNGHWITSSWCSDELSSTHSDGNCY